MRAGIVFSLLVLSLVVFNSCAGVRYAADVSGDRALLKELSSSAVFSRHHTGFSLYDPAAVRWICRYNDEKYFTPASNTKILTLLTCLHALGDSVESFRYQIRGDSLIFWGTGDPSLLYPHVSASARPLELLRAFPGDLYYATGHEMRRFGPGWSWDGFPYRYQVERSALPLYGNRVFITPDGEDMLTVIPSHFAGYVVRDGTMSHTGMRDADANVFRVNPARVPAGWAVEIPYLNSDYDTGRLLSDTLGKQVSLIYDLPLPESYSVVFGTSVDTLLRRMMQNSDNFVAEQLLIQCALMMRNTLVPDSAIAFMQNTVLDNAPDEFQWVDGSGISRYNLFTPRSMIWVLDLLLGMTSIEAMTEIFPAGGVSGTIEKWYGGDPPFVFAKTGTLQNQHCLSGYLRTDTGRWLIFSFMHNHITRPVDDVRMEMQSILNFVRRKY